MVIYLKHPVHGVKVATLDIEATQDVENGWVMFDPNEEKSEQVIAEPQVNDEISINELKLKRRRKIV